MESESILYYLQDIVETDKISNMAKLASLSILNKLFLKKEGTGLQLQSIQSGFTSTLITMLDSGLNGLGDPSEAVMISVAMEIICQFTKMPACSNQCLITESVIRILLDYLNSSSKFYQFPAQTKMILADVCEGKQLMGKVKVISMATEPLEYIHRHTKHKLKRVPDKIKVCKLIDTEYEEDLDVSDYLLKNQLAWAGNFPGKVVSESDEWENIIVTQVLDGGMFWAQVGEDAIKRVFDIQRQLNEGGDLVRITNSLIGDTVVVYGEIMGCQCYLRAQILAFDGSSVEVFAVDYGYTVKISDRKIYVLPENLNTKKVKRSISLCSVDGITPPPYDVELAHNAAAILVNLCKQSFPAGEIFEKLDGFQTIRSFLQNSSQPKLKAQVMTVLLNLAANYRLTSHITNGGFVKILLDIIMSYTQREYMEKPEDNEATFLLPVANDDKLLLARTVLCLTNILYGNIETRAQFYKLQGIDVILGLMVCMTQLDAIYMFCVRLLKAFLGRSVMQQKGNIKGQQGSDMGKDLQKTQSRNQNIPPRSVQNVSQKHDGGTFPFHDGMDSDSETESRVGEHNEKVQSGHAVMVDMDKSQGFFLGETLDVCDDQQHKLWPQRMMKSIKVELFAKDVCGMLNTGRGGSIYFGIDENSQVFGLELSRDEKDRFRLGVDQHMFNKISPVLLHSQFSIRDFPVIDGATGQVIPEHYVIEINVRGSKGTIYTMLDGACYYRGNSDTRPITRQALRGVVVIEEEKNYRDQIKNLEELKQHLLKELDT